MSARPSLAEVFEAVARRHGVTVPAMVARSRHIVLTRARQEAIYAARVIARAGWSAIGRGMAGRDHTTIMAGYRAHRARTAAPDWREADAAALAEAIGLQPGRRCAWPPRPPAPAEIRAIGRAAVRAAAARYGVSPRQIWTGEAGRAGEAGETVTAARHAAIRQMIAQTGAPYAVLVSEIGFSADTIGRAMGAAR